MNNENKDSKGALEILQLVGFLIGNEEYAVDILKVQEINRIVQITKVPNSPDFVEGVINLRGKVIPIIDLRIRMGMGKKEHDTHTRIIVVDISQKIIGFVVDEVTEVLRIPKNVIEAPPELATGQRSDFITGVGKLEDRLLILLDLDKIISGEESKALEGIS
jgi:purine-binding chemotaxis protein CheW